MQVYESKHAENMRGMCETMQQLIQNEIKISDKISFLECSENPLSADIGIIREGGATWLFDVGDGMKNIVPLVETGESYRVVLSHFHQDHMGNTCRIKAEEIYVSGETYKHVRKQESLCGSGISADAIRKNENAIGREGIAEAEGSRSVSDRCKIIAKDVMIGDLHLFPIPSSHAKGCLGLEVDGSYAFVGDALYCKARGCYGIYNAQLLKDEIAVLSRLQAPYLLVSHYEGLVRRKDEVIAELQEIYAMRYKNESEIRLPFQA